MYLPHIQVHSDQAGPIIMAECTVPAWNSHIFTSALKADVTIMFLNFDFLYDAKISVIRL